MNHQPDQRDGRFPVSSNLKAAVAQADITPDNVAAGIDIVGHRRIVRGVRDPLKAGVLLLDDGETKVAIITLDLIYAYEPMLRGIRAIVERETGIPGSNVMVAASHTHSAPFCDKEDAFVQSVIERIGAAAREARERYRTVSVGYGEDTVSFPIHRRKVIDGRAIIRMNPEGPNDPRVKVLRFDDGESLTPMAVLMHATCHPCCFTWGDKGSQPYPDGYPWMSADFPGEARAFVEQVYGGETNALFLQGCAGDIRPNLPGYPYRCADEADIQWCGRDLGGAVIRSLAKSVTREELRKRETFYPIRVASEVVELSGKEAPVPAELMAIKVGPFLFLTMPGEPGVEYGFKLEAAIADRAIPLVVGYANGRLGYIATADSYEVGGYEPEMSPLKPEAEAEILGALGRLADKVVGDVIATFSKHPQDIAKREGEEAERLKSK